MQVGRGWEMSNYAIESSGRQARLSFGCILLPELLAYTDEKRKINYQGLLSAMEFLCPLCPEQLKTWSRVPARIDLWETFAPAARQSRKAEQG